MYVLAAISTCNSFIFDLDVYVSIDVLRGAKGALPPPPPKIG